MDPNALLTPMPFDFSGGGGSRRRQKVYLPEDEQESQMAYLSRQTGSALENLFLALDTPGAIARGVIAEEPLSGFSWDFDSRVSGQDLNRYLGMEYDNPYVSTLMGLATEIAADPLALINLPKNALTGAGKAAKAAGLLDLAPVAAMNRMGYGKAAKTMTGRYTDNAFKKVLPEVAPKAGQPAAAAVEEALRVRPLLGPRYSRATTSLDEVIRAADNPQQALDDVMTFLKAERGIDPATNPLAAQYLSDAYKSIKDEKLGGLLGFGMPFGESLSVWNPRAAHPFLDALDSVGQRISWSLPVRYGSAWFDKPMGGLADAGGQIDMMRKALRTDREVQLGRRIASSYANQLMEANPAVAARIGAEGLSGSRGNSIFKRLSEGVPTVSDKRLLQQVPELQAVVDRWDQIRKGMIKESRSLGMKAAEYGDKYGVLWSPRYSAETQYLTPGGGGGRAVFGATSPETVPRVKYLQTPGGTDELGKISLLDEVREFAKNKSESKQSAAEVGEAVVDFIEQRYGQKIIGERQGAKMAQFMRNLKKGLPDDYPLFAEHPINAQARAIINHRRNVANQQFVLDKLTEHAVKAYPSNIQGGGWKSLSAALDEVGSTIGMARSGKTGEISKRAIRQVQDRLRQRFGASGKIDIDKYSIPQSVFNRLNTIKTVYESPQAWKDVWSLFEKFTTVFKGFVLAWPSRHVRDAYSNAFSIWLETGRAGDTLAGMQAASEILAGKWDKAMPTLRGLPQYSGLATDDDVRRAFINDSGGTGVLATLASSDLLSARQRAAVGELVPGSTPVTLSGGMKQMLPDGSRTPGQALKDFFTIQGVTSDWHTRNPLLNSSQQINDANDSIARLGGFIALMKQGVTPTESAKRITSALVDYGSLTEIERNFFKVIFPWWTYNSRIGKYVVSHMLEKPGGRYGQTVRALNTLQRSDDDHYLPTALREQFAVRVPNEFLPLLGKEAGGEAIDTYLKDVDLPGVDVINYFSGNTQDIIGNLAQQAHPLIRTMGELATDTDFFSKRPLSEAVTPLDRVYQQLFGTKTRLDPITKAVIQNLPGIQRPLSLAGGLADQRLTPAQRAIKQTINQLTGVKIQDVDESWKFSDMVRKIDKNLKGWQSSKPIEFIPAELLPEMPTHLLKQYMLKKEVERKANAIKKKKREAGLFAK